MKYATFQRQAESLKLEGNFMFGSYPLHSIQTWNPDTKVALT